MSRRFKNAGLAGLLLVAAGAQAAAQEHPWLDQKLLAAAQSEGGEMIIYSSTNEQEGLPLFKIFEQATGIKVNYVRASDAALMSRMMLEFRGNQKSWDIAQTATVNKVLPQLLLQFDPPEAKNIAPEARDPGRRWYGVYANYNAPAYNTDHVKASELPKAYDDFVQHKEWASHVAIDGTDNEWLKAIFEYYGGDKAAALIKNIVAALQPVVTDGHLAQARSVGSGEYWLSLNNYVNLTMNVKLAGGPIDYWRARSGCAVLRPGRRERQGAASEHGAARGKLHAEPGMRDLPRQVRPHPDARRCGVQSARHRRRAQQEKGDHGAARAR